MSGSKPRASARVSGERPHPSLRLLLVVGPGIVLASGGQPTTRGAQFGDVVQQAILRFRLKVAEQALGNPRGRQVRLNPDLCRGVRWANRRADQPHNFVLNSACRASAPSPASTACS